MQKFDRVDDYINAAPIEVRPTLKDLRKLIKKLAPTAEEGMWYGMPGYKVNKKPLVYFAGWKDHISIYPTSSKVEDKIPELAKNRTGKGTLQFSLDKPLPMDLISKLVEVRLKENLEK